MPRLVTIGDSLTQGFQSGAIVKTEWSWPKMVARALSIAPFRAPDFSAGPGGPILDIENLVRRLEVVAGQNQALDWYDVPAAAYRAMSFLDQLEDYWERGDGLLPTATGPLHHNVAVWGFEVGDADTLTDGVCRRHMPRATDQSWLQSQLPEFPMYRTARRTLNPSQAIELEELTQVSSAAALAKAEGPIENLCVFLGANNCLGTCAGMRIEWSQSADMRKLAHERSATLWDPRHFTGLLERLYAQVRKLQTDGLVQRVFVATVPHVTVAPIARGVTDTRGGRPEQDAEGYYEYYTHFWIWDDDFRKDPDKYPRLTREDARRIDSTIDAYNADIRARAEAHGWHVVDICQVLDDLAFRRNFGKPKYVFPSELVAALAAHPKTKFRVFPPGPQGEQRVLLDSRYLNIQPGAAPAEDFAKMQEKYRGGLFSLDGVHPTTIGYGIAAHEVLKVMQAAGVAGADPALLDWHAIVANDSLVTQTPVLLHDLQGLLGFFTSRGWLPRLFQKLAGYGSEPMTER